MKKINAIIFLLTGFFCGSAQENPKKMIRPDQVAAFEKTRFLRSASAVNMQRTVASSNFDVNFYRCQWEVDPSLRYIKGNVTSYFTVSAATNSITFDLSAVLRVDSIIFRGKKSNFQLNSANGLTIELSQTLPVGQRDSVSIFYQGVPVNDGFGSFTTSMQNGTPVMWTLSEPYGAKDWWPCKNASTDKADSIDIQLIYPAIYTSSSNGLLASQSMQGDKKISNWKHRYPIASYLVAFAITNYVVDNDSVQLGTNTMPVKMYAYPANTSDFRYATETAKLCLVRFSSLLGAYPFNKESFSQTQFSWGGGMEHQTNSFITSNNNQLVAHELAHQWFGDKVTCASWQDIWLNEGFAQYMQLVYLENFDSAMVMQYLDNNRKSVTSQPGGSVKVNDTTDVSRIFDSRLSYVKGAGILHMIRWRLGDALFFQALRQYLNDPAISYGTARTADLQRNLEQVSGQSFTEFFKDWYEGEGFPTYQVQWSAKANNWVTIRLNQTSSHPSVDFYEMPVPIRFSGANGRDSTVVLNHTKNGQEFSVNLAFTPNSAVFDPKLWLLTGNNTVTRTTSTEVSGNLVKIYPNPVTGMIRVSVANPTDNNISVRLFSSSGQLLYDKRFELSGRDEVIEIPAHRLPQGIYWLKVKGAGLNIVRKILK